MELSQLSDAAVLLRVDTGKANAMGRAFLNALELALDAFEAAASPALVITGSERFFSAGLDLRELIAFDAAALLDHMQRFERVMQRLFLLPRPVVAAVNGHAIAGGCVLALQADLRVGAVGSWKFGLNETRLGLGLPVSALTPARFALPAPALTRLVLGGELLGPEDAASLGLLDELVPADALLDRARARAEHLAEIPLTAFGDTKRRLRAPVLEQTLAASPQHLERWVEGWFEESTQERLRATVAGLTKG